MIKIFFRFYKPFTLKTEQVKSSVSTYTQETNLTSISDYTISKNLDLVFRVWDGESGIGKMILLLLGQKQRYLLPLAGQR